MPPGYRLFYTTIDFDGRIDDRIRDFVKPASLSSCHQVHGATIRQAPVNELECDALWGVGKNIALAIKVADCLPVSIIDPQHAILANIHSGWRGAVQGITAATVAAVPLEPSQSFAYLGPSIRVCCFEVGEEVAAQFDSAFVDRNRGPKPHLDIPAFTSAILRERGFENIIDTERCTRCDGSLFHSYRRDKKSGRNLAIVAQ